MKWISRIRGEKNMPNVQLSDGGGGSGKTVLMNPDELVEVITYLEEIFTEIETKALPNIEKLGNLKFYTDGKAKDTMEVYAEANMKIQDLFDHYYRASSLVYDILNTMVQTDSDLAKQIAAKLGV